MIMQTYRIRQFIHQIKREYRKRTVKQGLAYVIITAFFFFTVFFLFETLFDFSPFIRGIGILIAAIVILYILVQYLIRPSFKRLDDRRIALFVEEQLPDLEDRLNSAVEVNNGYIEKGENIIVDQLIEGAVSKTRIIDFSKIVDRKKERVLSMVSNVLLVLFLIFILFFSKNIKDVAGQLDISLDPVSEFDKAFMSITPGNIQIEKGESQEIVVEMVTDTDKDEDVVLNYRAGESIWRKQVMEKGIRGPVYIHPLIDIQEPIQYYVQFKEHVSSEYAISIYEFPKVIQIHLKYNYPDYTGVPTREEENTGDILGLQGSEVTLTIETNGTAESGEMIIDDSLSIPLQSPVSGKFTTTFSLLDTGSYHIRLTDSRNINSKFPEEYQIIPVKDESPMITITDPQRDVRANMVEEILLGVTVTDDYGVNDIDVKFSVNGGDENSESLLESEDRGEKDVDGSLIFYLEDYDLQAGDVISYYVEADDNCPSNDKEYSDMYFIEVTSLENRYTQESNRSGSGSGSGGQSRIVMNQQKIIAATWKLERMKKILSEDAFRESLDAITQAQNMLKENVKGRVDNARMSGEILDSEMAEYTDYLKNAIQDMDEALDQLNEEALRNAVKEEQQALNDLLKAEALNEEIRVSLQRGGAAGSGGGSSQERMQELEDLELDISKEKYEMQQQRQQEQQNRDVDETLEKVKELARRQENLAQRSRQEIQQEEEERFLDRLRRDQEELRRDAAAAGDSSVGAN